MENIKVVIENDIGFKAFIATVGRPHDKNTLLHYWRFSQKRKNILILRRLGPAQTQIVVQPPTDFNYTTKKLIRRGFNGFVAHPVPKETYLIFGMDEVLAQIPGANDGPIPVVEAPHLKEIESPLNQTEEILPVTKKRGRPKKKAS